MRRWIAAVVVLVGVALARPALAQVDNQCSASEDCGNGGGGGAPDYSPGAIIGGTGLLTAPTSGFIDSDDVWGYALLPADGTWPTQIMLNTGQWITVEAAGPVVPNTQPLNWNGIMQGTCAITGAIRTVGGTGVAGPVPTAVAYACSAAAISRVVNAVAQAIYNATQGWWWAHGGGVAPGGWYLYWYYHPIYSADGSDY